MRSGLELKYRKLAAKYQLTVTVEFDKLQLQIRGQSLFSDLEYPALSGQRQKTGTYFSRGSPSWVDTETSSPSLFKGA